MPVVLKNHAAKICGIHWKRFFKISFLARENVTITEVYLGPGPG